MNLKTRLDNLQKLHPDPKPTIFITTTLQELQARLTPDSRPAATLKEIQRSLRYEKPIEEN